ncbi:MAG: esterase-like activity of phytase family protein [Bdellovibrionota bacterium]
MVRTGAGNALRNWAKKTVLAGLVLFPTCTREAPAPPPPPADPSAKAPALPALQPEIIWDLLLEEPSDLAALPDGSLLSVGDGGRGMVYRIEIKGDRLEVDPVWLDTEKLRHPPHDPDSIPKHAPDLEGTAPGRAGRVLLGSEYYNEVWDVDLKLRAVVGLWRLPVIAPDGAIGECAGPSRNHGLEGVSFDLARGEVLAAHERCPPALALFSEKSGRPVKLFLRKELDDALRAFAGSSPDGQIGSLSAAVWTKDPGVHLLLDRLKREVVRIEIDQDKSLRVQGRWGFSGVFEEKGLHAQFGNVEGMALLEGSLYLLTDPGEDHRAQMARFNWPP